jgi:transcription antitermination factor NusG
MGVTFDDYSQWLAVQVRPRREITCASLLTGKGYETFVPTCFQSAHPLFSGYVFARSLGGTSARIVTTPGVIRLVAFAGQTATVDSSEIEAIRTVLRSGVPYRSSTVFQAGDPVRILDGALAGVEGTVCSIKSRRKLLVSIGLLQRSVLVDIDPLRLEHVAPPSGRAAHA